MSVLAIELGFEVRKLAPEVSDCVSRLIVRSVRQNRSFELCLLMALKVGVFRRAEPALTLWGRFGLVLSLFQNNELPFHRISLDAYFVQVLLLNLFLVRSPFASATIRLLQKISSSSSQGLVERVRFVQLDSTTRVIIRSASNMRANRIEKWTPVKGP